MENQLRTSLSKPMVKFFTDLYTYKQQWYRHQLAFLAACNMTALLGKLYWHYATGRYECTPPDFWSFVLSIGARFTWVFLFREPDQFAGFKRPRKGYRYAVIATAAATTLPNAVLHVWALKMAWIAAADVFAGVTNAVIAIIFWIILIGVVWWMALTLLLSGEDGDFEPVVRLKRRNSTILNIEPYTDDPTMPGGRLNIIVENGYLATAFEEQRECLTAARRSPLNGTSEGTQNVQPRNENISTSGDPNQLLANHEITAPLRCQTIARYEYMPLNVGPHSWGSFPLIPLVLISYATGMLIVQLLLLREDRRLAKFRTPSS